MRRLKQKRQGRTGKVEGAAAMIGRATTSDSDAVRHGGGNMGPVRIAVQPAHELIHTQVQERLSHKALRDEPSVLVHDRR